MVEEDWSIEANNKIDKSEIGRKLWALTRAILIKALPFRLRIIWRKRIGEL